MNQPPGDWPPDHWPLGEDPDDEPPEGGRPQPPSEWPRPDPPPGPPPPGYPGGEPPRSGMKPPWRDAPPETASKASGLAVLGFFVPWMLAVLAIAFAFSGGSTVDGQMGAIGAAGVLFFLVGLVDLVGTAIGFAASSLTARSIGYGIFIAFLTQLVAGAIAVVVLFGWCVSSFN